MRNFTSFYKAGLYVLSLWLVFQVLLALSIVFGMLFISIDAPALTILFDESSLNTISVDALSTINALAILANAVIAALCGLSLIIVWKGLLQKEKWAYWSLVFSLGFVQAIGFASDRYMGNKNFSANIISTILLAIGLALSSFIFSKKKR